MRTATLLLILLSGCIVEPAQSAILTASPSPFSFEDFREPKKPESTPPLSDNAGEKTAVSPPLVMVYGPRGCKPCDKVIAELIATQRYDACKAEITPAIAKVAAAWNRGQYPIVTFGGQNQGAWFVVWAGLKDFEARYNRAMKKAVAVETNAALKRDRFSAAAPHWTFPGNSIRAHLLNEHGYSAAQLAGLSDESLKSLHDAAHEGRTAMLPSRSRRFVRVRAFCPSGGGCPL